MCFTYYTVLAFCVIFAYKKWLIITTMTALINRNNRTINGESMIRYITNDNIQ